MLSSLIGNNLHVFDFLSSEKFFESSRNLKSSKRCFDAFLTKFNHFETSKLLKLSFQTRFLLNFLLISFQSEALLMILF